MLKFKDNIHGFWIGDGLRELELMSIKSFLYFGYCYHIWMYEQPKNLPDQVIFHDANTIVPHSIYEQWQLKPTWHINQSFANYFRYELMYQQGGWWADMGVICMKPLPNVTYCFTSASGLKLRVENEKLGLVKNIVNTSFRVPEACPLLKYIIEEIRDDALKGNYPDKFGQWGTILLSKHIVEQNLLQHEIDLIGSDFRDVKRQYQDTTLKIPDDYLVHFYNSQGKEDPKPNSLYARLRDKYL